MLEVEGVGETAVHGGGGGGDCEDTGPDALCGMVGQGLLHCVDDFCPDCGESTSSSHYDSISRMLTERLLVVAAHAGSCDRTCGFCPDVPADGKGKGRRRGQIVVNHDSNCEPADFETRTNEVNAACCDDGNAAQCAAGVPNTCDARCALTYSRKGYKQYPPQLDSQGFL